MPDNSLLALFLVGLLGGGHCIGMCGGIVGALALGTGGKPPAPAGAPLSFAAASAAQPLSSPPALRLHLAYNAGRIASYTAAGAIAGALGGLSLVLAGQLPLRLVLATLANLMLVLLGVYLTGSTGVLALVEGLGQSLWRRLSPLTRRFLPVRGLAQAFPLGLLWGWLPCGLVYSALVSALVSGSAVNGALAMAAFGLGTLPNLLLAGLLAARLRQWLTRRPVRVVAGIVVAGFGIAGLLGTLRLWLQL
jgi:sulfite exporter TauE/SafE